MTQVEQYISGERDYYNIKGGTGPLVYPAAHVYIYKALYGLTDRGVNIVRAQLIFAGLYLCTLALVVVCYRRAGVSPLKVEMLLEVWTHIPISGSTLYLSLVGPIQASA